ncbi:anhydro-N-acetylmuramic acid kinase [Silvimonas iriomotensis]|uniref:Anhydro-N-acetylmuramic acid kinase n=1 Tax=Silvimonas iriomotensis TaxID=449662 RepID=A0ABQ2P652_9NEIS|nr:anhydro-N-acetylmuramic acid kinase [Silvimonas iriomotensis]GGP18681.1 anhydro-N-acetylmuramic acid kinase [Silvimonas iriomotensis]
MTLTPEYYIGLMTGTSLDGVDAALVDFAGEKPHLAASLSLPLPGPLRAQLMQLQSQSPDELHLAQLAGNALADLYAEAVARLLVESDLAAGNIRAIGNHGQTVRHRPELGYTVQLGNNARLAELTGITVIGDFRSRDVAAGGQGAPLVPAFHQAIFGHTGEPCVVANIGGIANITILAADGEVTGFDTGPGNVLMDLWTLQHQGEHYDAGGKWAAQGHLQADLLQAMLSEPYFALLPPKSTGRDLFHGEWLQKHLGSARHEPVNVQATLNTLTARTIADAIRLHAPQAKAVYLCGGGAHNAHLQSQLQQWLPSQHVATTAALGVDPDWVEAYAFAWLAWRCVHRLPGNLPGVTGAHGPRILGAMWPA